MINGSVKIACLLIIQRPSVCCVIELQKKNEFSVKLNGFVIDQNEIFGVVLDNKLNLKTHFKVSLNPSFQEVVL